MRRPARIAPRVGAYGALCAVAAVAVAGCGSGAVRVPEPSPDTVAERRCAALTPPETLHGQSRADTEPRSRLTAAWGSPAITLRCGVPRPKTLHPTAQLVTINGIDWFPEPQDAPTTFTVVGRQAYVEVRVPRRYRPAGDVLIELGEPIAAAIPTKAEGGL